jgi:hypothetical protein
MRHNYGTVTVLGWTLTVVVGAGAVSGAGPGPVSGAGGCTTLSMMGGELCGAGAR